MTNAIVRKGDIRRLLNLVSNSIHMIDGEEDNDDGHNTMHIMHIKTSSLVLVFGFE